MHGNGDLQVCKCCNDGCPWTTGHRLKEVTLTFGYDPTKNFEFRVEGRYDDPDKVAGAQLVPRTYQGWFEAYYKF